MKGHYRTHNCDQLTAQNVGQSVVLSGWLAHKRNQGGIIFCVLRDHYGQTQLAVESSEDEQLYSLYSSVVVSPFHFGSN